MSLERIKQLEKISKQLEPTADERELIRRAVIQHTESFLEEMDSKKTYAETPESNPTIIENPISEEAISIDSAVNLIANSVDKDGINPASGKHLGYIPGGGLYSSSLADYWVDITNRYAGVFFANPGAVQVENVLIRWMTELMGYPQQAFGNLTSGGSIANLTAIVTARDAKGLNSSNIRKAVIYLSGHVHHCLHKAFKIAGVAEAQVRQITLDGRFRMKADDLQEQIAADIDNGLQPWMVVASAGTTDVGAIDPLDEIANIAEENGLWYHVDAAYGGCFMLCEEIKPQLKGIERSDSVVIDPHKGFFIPYGLGVVLVRNGEDMKKAFTQSANYMQDALDDDIEISPADVSPELTKHFRGLRLWLPLKIHGLSAFRAALQEKILLARYFYDQLNKVEGFEMGPYPELSVVFFRYIPDSGDANEFNKKLMTEIHKDGRVFLSSTVVDDKFVIRVAVLVFRTHLATIDLTLEILREKVQQLLQSQHTTV